MLRLSLGQSFATVGLLAFSLTPGAGVASAQPDLSPAINTTCNYAQVASALNAEFPVAGAQLNGSPTAQAALRGFLNSSPDQRRQIAEELENKPGAEPYVQQFAGYVVQIANTCNNY